MLVCTKSFAAANDAMNAIMEPSPKSETTNDKWYVSLATASAETTMFSPGYQAASAKRGQVMLGQFCRYLQ